MPLLSAEMLLLAALDNSACIFNVRVGTTVWTSIDYYLRERSSSGANHELWQILTIRSTHDNTGRYVCAALSSINRCFAVYLSIRVYRLI